MKNDSRQSYCKESRVQFFGPPCICIALKYYEHNYLTFLCHAQRIGIQLEVPRLFVNFWHDTVSCHIRFADSRRILYPQPAADLSLHSAHRTPLTLTKAPGTIVLRVYVLACGDIRRRYITP